MCISKGQLCFFVFFLNVKTKTKPPTPKKKHRSARSPLKHSRFLLPFIMHKGLCKQSHKGIWEFKRTTGLLIHPLLLWTARKIRSDRWDTVADILYLHIPGRMKKCDFFFPLKTYTVCIMGNEKFRHWSQRSKINIRSFFPPLKWSQKVERETYTATSGTRTISPLWRYRAQMLESQSGHLVSRIFEVRSLYAMDV